ncbi:acetoin dehydrogenase dihydrolipoyllysine-residue acetyltransferase subunit [Paracoccus alkanivorans]|uniref:Acetoin dehydrogenase dihydrolipoyllysine-residue acetyltransferase subunit n=1 Tax=Paracoccus alkanivorans TaxID=2116655 RepID=A0A3M0MQF9_9RHOB|nr:acetoin dehydrogenase dihydrolipoyllysine-residue acetyltransferase subunit [Paracoccus alkanivorans]RMC37950.1 acetoin dehydrogenase dihydrolipoyllysine-residue acetyltransferase subunit [Paracoccus alkanivorans]
MPVEVILPKVDMDMEAGLLAQWHVSVGDKVDKGAALFDIETDKAAMEVEAPASGIVGHIVAEAGSRIPVGQVVAWIYTGNEDIPGTPPGAAFIGNGDTAETEDEGREVVDEARPVVATTGQANELVLAESSEPSRPRATPAARAFARKNGIDLGSVTGSGPNGRIQADDVSRWQGEQQTFVAEPAVAEANLATPAPTDWQEDHRPLSLTRRKGRGGGLPVLLIHGFAADAAGWVPLEKALGNEREIIRIELPCHGRSPRVRVDSFREFTRMVVKTFDDLDAERLHLVGHSLGGAVATAIADIRPRRIASLSLISPAGLGPEIDAAALYGIARASRTDSLVPWLKRLGARSDAISHDFAKAAMMSRMEPELRAAQLELAEILFPDGTQSFDLSAAMERVEAPFKIVWGRQDRILPWEHALRAPDAAGLHLLDKAGHIPHIERPEAVALPLLENFRTGEISAYQR